MFHRIFVEEWQRWLNAIGILLFLAVFIATVIRAMRLPRAQIHHLETLPLQDDTHESTR